MVSVKIDSDLFLKTVAEFNWQLNILSPLSVPRLLFLGILKSKKGTVDRTLAEFLSQDEMKASTLVFPLILCKYRKLYKLKPLDVF